MKVSNTKRSMSPLQVVDALVIKVWDCSTAFEPRFGANNPSYIGGVCPGLVTIVRANSDSERLRGRQDQVTLSHFSVKQYLQPKDNGWCFLGTPSNIAHAHSIVARTCIRYPFHFDDPSKISQDSLLEYPLLRYAIGHWPVHLEQSKFDPPAFELA